MSLKALANKTETTPRVMVLRIEPASYMVALTDALKNAWHGPVDIVYVAQSLTQPWNVDKAASRCDVLPHGRCRSISAVWRRINATKPALLHVAGWSTFPSLAAILAGYVRHTPVTVDFDTWRGTSSCWRKAVKQLVYPHLFRLVAHFAPGGQRQAAYLRPFGVPDTKITPVGMTVDVTAIQATLARELSARQLLRNRFNISANAPVALFVGRLICRKGIDDLLAAWTHVIAEIPSAKLVIVGDGELRSLVATSAATDASILPVGRLSGLDVWRAYAAADCVVAPSRTEPWGLVVNEAMAVGVPIIITDAFGCVGDLARDDDTALVVPAASPQQLAQAMLSLLCDPEKRIRLASGASLAILGWTIEAEAQKIIEIWNDVLTAQ